MATIRYIDESKFLGRETVEYVRLANDAILAIKQLEDGIKNPRPGWASEDVERGRRSHELAIQLHRDELNRYAAKVEELNAQYGPRQGWSTQNSRQAVDHLRGVTAEALPEGPATLAAPAPGYVPTESLGLTDVEPKPVSAAPSGPNQPQPDAGPAEPLPTRHGQQVTLGEDFATNRNLSMPLTTQDFGEKAGPLTSPPPKPDPGQTHFLPETPGNALADPKPAPPTVPDAPAEAPLFAGPMTEEESRRAGSGLEADAETGRILTPTERWEVESNRPPPEPEAQPEKPTAEPQPEPAQTVKPSPETDREPDEAAYQRARMDRDCPLPDGDACIAIVKPATLRTDAKLFQYKAETDDQGVSVKLADVKTWDPDLAGVAYVWERADGERFIVDGHQRLALAQRLRNEGQDPDLLVKIWREADGYTPRTMRLSAAKKNIAEGSGTAVDAARVLREEPGLFDTLSQKNAIVRDAKGLARLDQDVFSETVEYVNAGHLPENVASLIAGVGPDPALQRGALREFVREQRRGHITRTAGENLLYAIRRNRLDEVEAKAQGTLTGFDVGAVRESAWRERAALQQGLVNAFRNDRRLFGEVVRGDSRLESVGNVLAEESNESELTAARANIEIFDRLANKRGPLADYLDAEAARVKKRMDETGASRQGAAAATTRDAARYLRPFLKTYIEDGGAPLAGNLAAKEPEPAPAPPPTSGAATTTTPTAAPAPRRDRPRVTPVQVSQPKPPAVTSAAREPVTAEAVKESGRRSGQARSTTRERIQVPAAEKGAAPPKSGSQRAQPKGKGGSAKTPRRTTRQSPFTPAEVRRFKQDIARSMKR